MKRKHNLTKEKIIKAAFKEWGKNKFCKTSLSDLADRLNITKTALYRHFKNKEDLIFSMENEFKDQLTAPRTIFLVRSEHADTDTIIRSFYSTYMPLFLKNPHLFYFLFLLSVMKLKKTGSEPDYFWQESSLLRKSIQADNPNVKNGVAELFIRFIYTTGASQIINTLEKPEKISEKSIERVIDLSVEIVLTGIRGGKNGSLTDPITILKGCSLSNTSIVTGEKLYSAIAKVVAKEGIEGATTDKIAREIGITKSSLYFHFKNKQDMLNEMIIDNQQNFMPLFTEKAQIYSKAEEKIICYMGMVGAWLMQDPAFLSVFTWIWFQRMELEMKPPENPMLEELYTIFRSGIAEGEIKSLGITEKQLAAFIIRLVGMEVQLAIKKGNQSLSPASELHHIVLLLFRGIHYFTHRSTT